MLACCLTLLAPSGAQAVPSVTYECTPAPEDCRGWFRSDVSIDWTVIPSDAAVTGCQDKTFTADTPETNEFCRADDGSAAVTVELKIRVDQTPPVVTGGTPGRAADSDGWYNHAVSVAFAGSDLTSGLESCTETTYGGPDSGAARVEGRCVDNAGNVSEPFGYGLKYDATAPAVTDAAADRAEVHGWFNGPVRFDVEGADATSGIAGCPFQSYDGPDSATASVTGTCHDRAGNSATRVFPLRYDASPPVAVASGPERPADHAGWYTQPVAVGFNGSDQLSGIDACTTTTYAGPDGATASVPGTCTDMAGNVSAPARFALSYDATRPVVTGGRPARAADADGWYNHAVDVAFAGSDQTSGIEACSTGTYAGPDSATASLAGTCRDRAGNVSNPLGFGLKYDATPPEVTAGRPARAADADGWYNRAVAYAFTGADATSGIAACPAATYAGPDSATATVRGHCTDHAGNSADREFGLKYDATAPAVTGATADRSPNAAGWYNRSVELAFAGSDGTSGVRDCTRRAYAGPDSATASVTGTCTDVAGNVSGAMPFELKYDATAPVATGGTAARAPDGNGWYRGPVSVAFAGTDQTSGIAGCAAPTYGGPDSGTASVSGTCADRAGNTSAPLPFGLKYDATAPEVLTAVAARAPDHAGWYVSPVRFDFTGRDAMSGVETCPSVTYSGPDAGGAIVAGRCRDRAGNSTLRGFPLDYDATAPPLTDLAAAGADRSLFVSWRTSEDARSVSVLRTPGIGTELTSSVFGGPGSSFTDRRVDNGVRYAYEVRLRDAAGNERVGTVSGVPAVPGPVPPAPVETVAPPPPQPAAAAPAPAPVVLPRPVSTIAPAAGTVLALGRPPLLEWPRDPRARYYNVQLFRGGRKILTVWPTVPRYQLKMRWTYRGKRWRLSAGRYRWVVWPGYGRRAKADYGKRLAASTFVVRRAP